MMTQEKHSTTQVARQERHTVPRLKANERYLTHIQRHLQLEPTDFTQPVIEPIEFDVLESDYDVDTNIYVPQNSRVVLSAWGEIWAGVWLTGNNGPQGWLGWHASSDSPLPYAAPFQLLGRIQGRYFPIGNGVEFIYRDAPSKLALRINDNRPGNGWGKFTCRVEIYVHP
jgi:hypothetical protein